MDVNMTTRYLDDLAALGVTVPEKTAAARSIFEAALIEAGRQPATQLKDALEAGNVTANNVGDLIRTAALEQAAQQSAHQIVRDLHLTLNRAMRDGLREDAERIRAELDAAWTPAAEAVTKAAAHFGPDTQPAEVLNMPAAAVTAWKSLTSHSATLDAVARAYRTLLSDVVRDLPDPIVSLFISDGTKLEQAEDLYRANGSWLALAHAGIGLRLNTPEQAATVRAEAEALIAAAEAAERQTHLAEHRRRYMPVGMG